MKPPTKVSCRALTGENRSLSIDQVRQDALDRLYKRYKRREAVQHVICALEVYEKSRRIRMARSAGALRAGLHTIEASLLGPHPDVL
jgi:hypothetical protein